MKEALYRHALTFGWETVRKHPFLWIYGLFAAMLGGGGIFDTLSHSVRVMSRVTDGSVVSSWQTLSLFWHGLFIFVRGVSADGVIWSLWLLIITLGIAALFLVAAVVSQGALISAAASHARSRRVALDGREWHIGVSHFWRLAGINGLRIFFTSLLAGVVGVGAAQALERGSVADVLLFLFVFLLATTMGVIISFISLYAAGYIVVEEYSFSSAVAAAWHLFADHWLVSIEIGFIFLLLQIGLAILAAVGFIVLLLPSVFLWFFAVMTVNHILFSVAVMLFLILFMTCLLALSALFTVFSISTWTFLFMKMHRYGMKSRVVHWLSL